MNRVLKVSVLLISITGLTVKSQEITWKAGFFGFFDNREYFNEYAQPQSILGARTFAEGGFRLDMNSEFGLGIDYMYEFGSEPDGNNINPILFYHYNNHFSDFYMGAFHRHDLLDMPLALQNDTFTYYKPNMEGIYLQFYNDWGSQTAWLDWTSRQTLTARETFLIGLTGKARFLKDAFLRYDFLMYHYAGTAAEQNTEVRDNGGLTAVVGVDLKHLIPIDSLTLSTGYAGSYDRFRGKYDLRYTHGSLSELYASYKMFGLRSTMYIGDGQTMMVGDPMYSAPFYNRNDFIFKVLRKGKVSGCIDFSLHFIPGVLDFSQKFTIYIDISGKKHL